MPKPAHRIISFIVVLGVCFALAACGPTRRRTRLAPPPPPHAPAEAYTPPPPSDVREWPYAEAPAVPKAIRVHKRLQRVTFPAGSSALNGEARGALRETATLLKENPRWHILVVGLTDNRGETQSPMKLCNARANSVKAFLVDLGVAERRLSTMALGSKYAKGDKFQPTTVARDRRVELWAFM